MTYKFLDSSVDTNNLILPNSDKINTFLLKNNETEITKALDFIASNETFLYLHGFMGTGKRQFANYICDFLSKDVIRLEYYCKQATVCDDILLSFINKLENGIYYNNIHINAKITTLSVKFNQLVASIKKPILIILHSFDDIQEENSDLISSAISSVIKNENVKIIISTRALRTNVMGEIEEDRKIFLKAFTKNIFKEFLIANGISTMDTTIEDFYKYTRGYYYYTTLAIKIIQALKIELSEFLVRFNQSEKSFEDFLSTSYIELIPNTIRNFFWFLRTIRHGLTLNALAIFELYDEFSIEYLKQNHMIFISEETVFVQDFFLRKNDIAIPAKTEIKLHKYIINIYEKQLKEPLAQRIITISRQALRAEIEYHTECIYNLQNGNPANKTDIENTKKEEKEKEKTEQVTTTAPVTMIDRLDMAQKYVTDKKYTEAIETYHLIMEMENIDLQTLIEVRANLSKLYKQIGNYSLALHYYELVETYYKQHKEFINLNYLYYDMTDLLYKMYKIDRAIETIKKVIYSVDTPQSLLVASCILLGNIYSEINNTEEAYSYYQKALDSIDDNDEKIILAELYFKYALANDDKENIDMAFNYYNKCLSITKDNPYRALAYSNMASCYMDQESYDDALFCFQKAYDLEKKSNNYEGIYYTSSHIAKIYTNLNHKKAYDYLIEAKKSAEFINDDFYILEATTALGDYYYNNPKTMKESLKEYFKAITIATRLPKDVDISIIQRRVEDMRLRMNKDEFAEIERKYDKRH